MSIYNKSNKEINICLDYDLEFVSSLCKLSEEQIRNIEKKKIIIPKKIGGMKYYSFQDIYVLKIISYLSRRKFTLNKIDIAIKCLRDIKPEKDLSALTLFHTEKEILDLTDDPAIITTKYAQIVNKDLVKNSIRRIAIGSVLDETRVELIDFVKILKEREKEIKNAKTCSIKELKELLYG